MKHERQRRKNIAASPYINHPIEVAEYLNRIGGITDENILVAAILHDNIEDTATTPDEIREQFSEAVLGLVLECTDDKSLEKRNENDFKLSMQPRKAMPPNKSSLETKPAI